MNIIQKALTTLGGIFLAALLIAALAPKATRGVAAALVQVTNTSANPVPVSAADNPANFPFTALLCESSPLGDCAASGEFRVPSSTSTGLPVKRFVIENVSGQCHLTPGIVRFSLGLDVFPAAGTDVFFFPFPLVPASPSNSPESFVVSGSAVRIYTDPGDNVLLAVNAGVPNGDSEVCDLVVQGHLETK